MTLPPSPGPAGRPVLLGPIGRIVATVAGILLALAGFVLVLGALAVGLVAAAGLVIWALLRGRKPTIIRFGGGAAPFARRPVRPTDAPPPAGEVIEGVVREVPPDPPR